MSPTYVLLLHTYIHISKYVSRLVIFSKYKYEREGLNRNTNLSAFSRRDSRSSNAFFGRDRRGGGKEVGQILLGVVGWKWVAEKHTRLGRGGNLLGCRYTGTIYFRAVYGLELASPYANVRSASFPLSVPLVRPLLLPPSLSLPLLTLLRVYLLRNRIFCFFFFSREKDLSSIRRKKKFSNISSIDFSLHLAF